MDTNLRTEGDVEQKFISPLFRDVLGYQHGDLAWKRPIQVTLGREKKDFFADLVVSYKGSPVIAVEAKRPTEPVRSGLGQVDSYAFTLQTPYSVVTNGRQFVLRGYYSFNSRINVIDEAVADLEQESWRRIKNLISFENIPSAFSLTPNEVERPDPQKIKDYRRFFRRIRNEIRDRDKLDPSAAFDELSKLLFLKAAEDEWSQHAPSKPVLTSSKIDEWEALGRGKANALVNEWFQTATSQLFPGVFDDHPRIELSASTLKVVLDLMRPFHIKNGDVDVKGRAFEEFLPSQLRGEGLGQFFTPRPIVNFMADMASISIQDVVVDFSCGSGGFLIKAFEQMQRYVEELPAGTLKRMGTDQAALLDDIKTRQIFGVDAEPRAARTAKMNMIMWGDGRRVVRGNALDDHDFSGKPYEPPEYTTADPFSGCSLILANPPFGSKEKNDAILRRYDLAGRGRERKSERTEILFVEKGLRLLRPEGKMLIVLPQGLLSGAKNARVRDYIHSQAEIRAIITLPTHTFVQSGVPTVNTCILFVQKFTTEKKKLYDERTAALSVAQIRECLRSDPDFDYPIFMGSAEFIGYEPSGRMIVSPGEKTDLDLLCEDFLNWSAMARPDINVFEFAQQHYGARSHRRKDQVIRGTQRGLKASFVVPFSKTSERLDPPSYLLRLQAGRILDALHPLGVTVKEKRARFRPRTEDEKDAEYSTLTVSSDGTVTLNERVRGEAFKEMKRVATGDIVYNPMRVNIGSIGVVPPEHDGGLVSPDYVVFRSEDVRPDFLVTLLRSPFYRMYIDVVSTGSIRDRLYFQDLKNLRVPTTPPALQATICDASRRADDESHALIRKAVAEKNRTIYRINSLIHSASADTDDLEGTFLSLVDRWRNEVGMLSSPTKKMAHPVFKGIVALGPPVIPLILRELEDRPAPHWVAALEAITHEQPLANRKVATLQDAVRAWIAWAKAKETEK